MYQPIGFVSKQLPYYVCKLNKVLYGLKQALKAWFFKLSKCLEYIGFKAFKFDSSIMVYDLHNDFIVFSNLYG